MTNPSSLKPSLSPFVAIAFVVIAATGMLLLCDVKNGPIMALHEGFGCVFAIAGAIHLLLNWRPLLSYVQLRRGLLSLGLALALAIGFGLVGLTHRGGPHDRRPPVTQQDDA